MIARQAATKPTTVSSENRSPTAPRVVGRRRRRRPRSAPRRTLRRRRFSTPISNADDESSPARRAGMAPTLEQADAEIDGERKLLDVAVIANGVRSTTSSGLAEVGMMQISIVSNNRLDEAHAAARRAAGRKAISTPSTKRLGGSVGGLTKIVHSRRRKTPMTAKMAPSWIRTSKALPVD